MKPDLSINKDKGTSVDVREVSEKDDLDSNRKCQGSDSLHRLLKSFTLTQIGKKEGQLDRSVLLSLWYVLLCKCKYIVGLQRFFGYSETKQFSSILEVRKVNRVFENN